MHRQPGDIWRIDYQLDPSEDAEVETREPRIRERIASHLRWLGDDRPWTLEWHGFYKAHALALDSFVHDRMRLRRRRRAPRPDLRRPRAELRHGGRRDLAWMLAAVIGGTADRALLDTYSAERHHAWEQNVANAGKSTLIMTPGDHGHRTTRDALLALATVRPEFGGLINPRQSSATHARPSPLTMAAPGAGGLLPGDPVEDRRVRLCDGKETSLNEIRGTGFALFGVGLGVAEAEAAARLRDELAGALPAEHVTLALLGTAACSDPFVPVLGSGSVELAQAWGAEPGEVFVVRPDGLLLARGRIPDFAGLPRHVLVGGATGAGQAGGAVVALPAEQVRREAAWLALSDGINAVPVDDREGFLARLTLVLGDLVGTDDFRAAVSTAASVR